MLSIIPPTVKSVGAAIVTPKPPSFFRIKSATRGGGARRALTDLGSNNAQVNMNMAQSHLAMIQEVFTSRWNFSPVKEVPLTLGRYQWVPLGSGSNKNNNSTPSENVAEDPILLKDITNPVLNNSPHQLVSESTNLHKTSQDDYESNGIVLTNASNQENSENEAKPETQCKQVLSPRCKLIYTSKKKVTSGSQMCVTDFFRPAKRKTCNHYEDCQANTDSSPSKKKLRTVQ